MIFKCYEWHLYRRLYSIICKLVYQISKFVQSSHSLHYKTSWYLLMLKGVKQKQITVEAYRMLPFLYNEIGHFPSFRLFTIKIPTSFGDADALSGKLFGFTGMSDKVVRFSWKFSFKSIISLFERILKKLKISGGALTLLVTALYYTVPRDFI